MGRVARVAAVGCVSVFALLALVLGIGAVHQIVRADRLQRHGVAVPVTVTHCLGLASGTGITVAGYRCHGTFSLAGVRYDDVIGGTSRRYRPGATITGVTDPAHPSTLSTAVAAAKPQSTWRLLLTPALLAIAALGLLSLQAPRRRHRVVRRSRIEARAEA